MLQRNKLVEIKERHERDAKAKRNGTVKALYDEAEDSPVLKKSTGKGVKNNTGKKPAAAPVSKTSRRSPDQ